MSVTLSPDSRRTARTLAIVSLVASIILGFASYVTNGLQYPDADVVVNPETGQQAVLSTWMMTLFGTVAQILSQAASILLTAAILLGAFALIPRRAAQTDTTIAFPPPSATDQPMAAVNTPPEAPASDAATKPEAAVVSTPMAEEEMRAFQRPDAQDGS